MLLRRVLSVLQRGAVCVVQCGAVLCIVVKCGAVSCRVLQGVAVSWCGDVLIIALCVAVCCCLLLRHVIDVLRCVAGCCLAVVRHDVAVVHRVAVCYSVLQCATVSYCVVSSVRCGAVCRTVLHCATLCCCVWPRIVLQCAFVYCFRCVVALQLKAGVTSEGLGKCPRRTYLR